MTIVPDASVLLKLDLQQTSDPDHDDAIRFIRAYQNERFLRTGGILLTADSRYVKKASRKRQVTLLSDWSV